VRVPAYLPLVLSAAVLWPAAHVGAPDGAVVATGLRCESRIDPLGIDEAQPRLSWVLQSARRGQGQTAYQVLVATTSAALAAHRGDLWDTGKVASSQSVQVAYGGAALESRTICYWKVRVWDASGGVSPWSAPARWEMALVSPRDWTAVWVNDGKPNPSSDEGFYAEDPAPLFRRAFTLPAAVVRARLYMTGLGYYEASLNGARVGDRVLDPGWTAYGSRVYYSTYDVTRELRQGDNCFGVTVGNGWYNPLPLRMWGRLNLRDHLTVGRPRFIAQLEVELADGSRRSIVSDPGWRVTDGPLRFNSVYLGEVYDARLEPDGWNRPGFDDTAWRRAAPAPEPVGKLQAQPQPPIRVTATLVPTGLLEPAPGVFIFDLGQNFAGWASLTLTAPRGTRLTLRYGELLNADGTLNPLTSVAGQIKGRRTAKDGTSQPVGGSGAPDVAWQADTYVARGGGPETYTPRFTFHGFRYVEVQGYPGRAAPDALKGLRLNADVEAAGTFTSSSARLNRIQAMTRWTFLSNLFSVQSDCPHREKFGYGGDIVATSDALLLNFDMAGLYAKSVVDWSDAARSDGMLTDTAPFVGIQYCGVGWAMVHPVLQSQLYAYYGDRRLVERQYETSRRWLDLLAAANPGHIVKDGLGDHEALAASPPELLLTPLYVESARLVARLATILGRRDDAARYLALADGVATAFSDYRLKAAAAAPGSRTQSATAYALHAGLVPPGERPAAVQWLLDDIRDTRGGHLATGIFGTNFALDVLSREGHAQAVFDAVSQDTFPGWGHMLESGATTLWEHWALSDNTYSHNHPMFGSISQWFFNWLGGIQPDADAVGFDRVVIRPQMVRGLDWVHSSYGSVRGLIVSDWSRTADGTEWRITIPVNATARIVLPAGAIEDLREGPGPGVPLGRAAGIRDARMEGRFVVVNAGSGTYRFVSRPRPD